MFRLVLTVLLASASASAGAAPVDPPIPPAELAALRASLREQLATLDRAIRADPANPGLRSRRGDAHLFLGQFEAAVADFEKMIALDPTQDAPHWRLGIAYHFAGNFARSSAQFEKYHAYDDRDRENGIWKFLGDVKLVGIDRARQTMLPYARFDREPFPALYDLLAGRRSASEFFADLSARGLDHDPRVMFFANYYAALDADLHGDRPRALARLRLAVANTWGRTSENGPAYMWQVARLHYEQLSGTAVEGSH